MFRRIAIAIILALLCVPALGMNAGAAPPPFDQNTFKTVLEQNRGKVVMLNFFATWCPPCRAEIPDLVKMAKKYPRDLAIIGLTLDTGTISKVEPFCREMGVQYPVYRPERQFYAQYGFSSIPYNVFYDRKGRMILAGAGIVGEDVIEQVIRQTK